jgi:hypothetical protein
MGDFFQGWKRRIGCALLLVTLAFMCGSARSYALRDHLSFPVTRSGHLWMISESGVLFFFWTDLPPGSLVFGDTGWIWISGPVQPRKIDESAPADSSGVRWPFGYDVQYDPSPLKFWWIEHWIVALSLTCVSAVLLLAKPRTTSRPATRYFEPELGSSDRQPATAGLQKLSFIDISSQS